MSIDHWMLGNSIPSGERGSEKSVERPHNPPPGQPIVSSAHKPSAVRSHSPLKVQAGERRRRTPIEESASPTKRKKLSTPANKPSNSTDPTDCNASLMRNGVRGFCESLVSNGSASSADEIMFLMLVEDYGLKKAIEKASILDLRCLRPLQALFAANVRGENYSENASKRELRSVSARSQKSRPRGALSSRMGSLK